MRKFAKSSNFLHFNANFVSFSKDVVLWNVDNFSKARIGSAVVVYEEIKAFFWKEKDPVTKMQFLTNFR